MAGDGRVRELATEAVALAERAGVTLPEGLRLWELAGCRPAPPSARAMPCSPDAAARGLVDALEIRLQPAERRRGAHYTPSDLADDVVRAAGVDGADQTVVDPACGGGALLLAAARRLPGERDRIVRRQLFGADVDPLAVAVAEAALALWAGGAVPPRAHLVVGDPLLSGRSAWPGPPPAGFDRVVGNPPFQGQLGRGTARDEGTRGALRDRFGAAAAAYSDTAALFLLAAVDLAARGARVALVQPQSVVAARDAGPVRVALARRARLVDLLLPAGRPFAANVNVCVPVLEVGGGESDGAPPWSRRLAEARGVPDVELDPSSGTVADRAEVVAGFRRHYYGLVGHVADLDPRTGAGTATPRLVTSGLVDVGSCAWGCRPVRFARRVWTRPVVDVDAVRDAAPALGTWLDRTLRPKVVVATQTRVVEAAADRRGSWVPSTPLISVVPAEASDVDRLAAALCAPPVAAWVAAHAAGTGLSPGTLRLSAALVRAVPLPSDDDAWDAASAALAARDLDRYADAATAMHALPPATATAVRRWWDESRLGRPRGLR